MALVGENRSHSLRFSLFVKKETRLQISSLCLACPISAWLQPPQLNSNFQLDILLKDEGRCIDISDVLSNDVLMFHFMEFVDEVEGRGHRSMLEFWMSVANFKRRLKSPEICLVDKVTTTPATMSAQNDAIVIYEKFISMQASSPLGFASELRYNFYA